MNDDRRFLEKKELLYNLLGANLPIKLIALCLGVTEQTINKYISRLKKDEGWNGKIISFTDSIPGMLALIAVLVRKRQIPPWMKLPGLSTSELRNHIYQLLEINQIIKILNISFRNLGHLRDFGFEEDVPLGYRKFLNSLILPKFYPSGEIFWIKFLDYCPQEPSTLDLDIDYQNWPNAMIDKLMANMIADIRPEIAPVFTSAVCAKVDALLLTLTFAEAKIIRLYFGLDGPALSLDEIGFESDLTRERIRQIKEKALRKSLHEFRLEMILAFPLSWEKVSQLLDTAIEEISLKTSDAASANASSDQHLIFDQDFSVRALNVLTKAGFKTLEELAQLSIEGLLKYRDLGKKSLDEIESQLRKYGLSLRE